MLSSRSRFIFNKKIVRSLATSAAGVKTARVKAAGTTPQLTDVLIVGGGPAGLTLAAAIQSSHELRKFKTVLVEAGDTISKVKPFYNSPPDYYTNRVVSLTPPSIDFLTKKINVKLMENRMMPYDGMYVTDGISNATIDMEKDSLAYMIEILNVQSSLLARIDELNCKDRLQIIDKTKVESIVYSDPNDTKSWPIVTLSNGQRFQTRLLVGADGFNSPVRTFSGIQSRGWFYNKFGVVSTMKLEYTPFKIRGWQRFLPTGPIAHLPLPDDNATLVWSTTDELSELLLSIKEEEFTALINAAFVLDNADMKYYYKHLQNKSMTSKQLIDDVTYRIDEEFAKLPNESDIDEKYPTKVKMILGPSRARFPLKMFHADKYCTDRIVLLGDAAHATHPLAGQGLNMGQGDTEALVDALEKASKRGLDIGSELALDPFWAERYPTNTLLLGVADKCHKIYSTDFPPVVKLRSLGADVINNFSPLKNLITDTLGSSAK
ncbi:hypothetical protein TPHA_0B04290 [Tetrapisispora phaffii CBS 4417]|uniref:Ubiquinone biosynthesis monooxygenase COQ6, mitochondrial n=1 Tax=Tetrapisispora phaffii (strain ATCC 24235 / CBS 4417 / NBRC 1672 / NRRL Y-8282 / UCD 70-5) TaxID=1071381 RepID=G8BQ17_TETPH|nr:hypothetical protein TPHA_0B04290 [Tetrapisispora phaffii CBS 4417]CCE62098.1 hypothetical protein TPHA_0B04290 [Tetrapisispora phaffii CBS 4417]